MQLHSLLNSLAFIISFNRKAEVYLTIEHEIGLYTEITHLLTFTDKSGLGVAQFLPVYGDSMYFLQKLLSVSFVTGLCLKVAFAIGFFHIHAYGAIVGDAFYRCNCFIKKGCVEFVYVKVHSY